MAKDKINPSDEIEPFNNGEFWDKKMNSIGLHRYGMAVIDDKKIKSWHREPYYHDENEGIYLPAMQKLRRILTTENVSTSNKENIIKIIIDKTDQTEEQIVIPENIIACNNGLLNLKTRKLKPFTPELFIRNKIPVDYNPKATCPNIEKFFKDLLENEHVLALKRMLACFLKPNTNYSKAFFFEGSGANGKSVLCELITLFLGKNNVLHNSLHDLTINKFRAATLDGKIANIYPDLGSDDIMDSGMFKTLASGDKITVERKNQDPYNMTHYCKFLFSANSIPLFRNIDEAVLRRMVIIPFERVFEGESKKDKSELLEKMTTKEEFSGLLNVVLDECDRLRPDIFDKPLEEIRKQYLSGSDSLGKFER